MRIAFLGACGTGKTTLVEAMYKDLGLKPVYNNARNVMAGLGITDLTDVENTKRALLCESILIKRLTKQLELIDEGFISDRSIIDELMYWELDNEKNFPSLTTTLKDFVYSFLNKFKYDLLICIPVEFDLSEKEKNADRLRWVDEHRYLEDKYVKKFYNEEKEKLNCCKKIIMITGSIEDRKKQINEALKELDFEPKKLIKKVCAWATFYIPNILRKD